MESNYNSRLSQEIRDMKVSVNDINKQDIQQQLGVCGYNPNEHLNLLHQYEAVAGKVPTSIAGMLKNRSLLKEERRLARELEPYNNFAFSYQESGSLPTENIGKESVIPAQSKGLLTDCYSFIKELPMAQFYNVEYDMNEPFRVYGSIQDHHSFYSEVDLSNGKDKVKPTEWDYTLGAEGSTHVVDTRDNNSIFASLHSGSFQSY